jgi:hypothetical protein
MDSGRRSTATAEPGTDNGTEALLQSLIHGAQGRALRTQLGGRYPDCSRDEIEEAIQYACKSFLDEANGISVPGQVYTWIRTASPGIIEPASLPNVGERAKLRRLVERFPHFWVAAGAEGTITEATELIALKMDEHVDGAEEWDNELCWTPEDGAFFPGSAKQQVAAVFYADVEIVTMCP